MYVDFGLIVEVILVVFHTLMLSICCCIYIYANRWYITVMNIVFVLFSCESFVVCVTGPALLFERYISASSLPRRYYACSACRNRKECNFFQSADCHKYRKRLSVKHQRQEARYHESHVLSFSR